MDYKERLRHIPLGVLVGLATLMLASGGSVAWFTWRTLNPPAPPVSTFPSLEIEPETSVPALPEPILGQVDPASPAETPNPEPTTPAPAAQLNGQIYWVQDDGTALKLVPQTISVDADTPPDAQVKAAFDTLLTQAGDPAQNAATTIPESTQLLAASVQDDGIHVNLSSAFETGGGSASMMGRLGQVIYTATAFDPNAPVWISVEGQPLTLLGGEGLEVSQPMTREEFNQGFGF